MKNNIQLLWNNKAAAFFCLLAVFIFYLFFRIDLIAVGNGSEFRAEIAREMVVAHNYFVPVLNDQLKLSKPPLYYDWIILFYKLSGETTLFWARLSSIISSLLIVLCIYFYSIKVLKVRNIYILLGLMFFSPMFLYCSRRAEIEIFLTLEILLCFIMLHYGYLKASRFWLAGSYVMLALVFFTKGPIIFLFIAFWLLLYLLIKGRTALVTALKKIWSWQGSLLFLLIAGYFSIQYYSIRHLFLKVGVSEVGIRFPLLAYLKNPFIFLNNFLIQNPLKSVLFLFPLSLFTIFILKIKDKKYDLLKIVAFGIILSIFTFNEVSDYYFVPAIPFFAMLCAKLFEESNRLLNRFCITISVLVLLILNVAFYLTIGALGLSLFLGFLLGSIVYFVFNYRSARKDVFLVCTMAILYFCVINFFEPLDISNDNIKFFKQIRQEFQLDQKPARVYSLDKDKTAFSYGLQSTVLMVEEKNLLELLKNNGNIYLLIDGDDRLQFVKSAPHVQILRLLKFHSELADTIYPKIPVIKAKAPETYFSWLKYKP